MTARLSRRGTADVERSHCQLSSGLAYRLGRDDADSLAEIYHTAGRKITARNTSRKRRARSRRSGRSVFSASLFRISSICFSLLLRYFGSRFNKNGVRDNIDDVIESDLFPLFSQRASQPLHRPHYRAYQYPVQRITIVFAYNDILGNVNKPPGEIS